MLAEMKSRVGKVLKSRRNARDWPGKVDFYANEYTQAKSKYEGTASNALYKSPSDLGVVVARPDENNGPFKLAVNHLELVESLVKKVNQKLEDTSQVNYFLVDQALQSELDEQIKKFRHTSDLPLVKNKEVAKVYLKETTDLPELEAVAKTLVPLSEEKYYQSYLWVEKAAVIRSIGNKYPDKKSTLWHTDNHFESITKIMVYLNDVGPDNAPFEFLRHKEDHHVLRIKAHMPQYYKGGRVPLSVIDKYLEEGYERHQVLGPKGTVLFFDDKVIHKGNEPTDGFHRDVVILQLRPSDKKLDRYLVPGQTMPM